MLTDDAFNFKQLLVNCLHFKVHRKGGVPFSNLWDEPSNFVGLKNGSK